MNNDQLKVALIRLERAVDMHLGRSAWTQTSQLKGYAYREAVREELYAAHDAAREVLTAAQSGNSASLAEVQEQKPYGYHFRHSIGGNEMSWSFFMGAEPPSDDGVHIEKIVPLYDAPQEQQEVDQDAQDADDQNDSIYCPHCGQLDGGTL